MGNKLLIFLALLALGFIGFTKYNRMATMEKDLVEKWLIIESQYQHKSDVIFGLSRSIEGNLDQDMPLFNQVTKVRNSAAQITVDIDNINDESLIAFREAYAELIALQVQLLDLSKQYPDPVDTQDFRELKAELEGTEIRIANERRRMNEQVANYNKYINGFFNLAIAQAFGFNDWPLFTPILGE